MRVFTLKELRENWSKGKGISYRGILYRVGRMSYGDYFLEPGQERRETEPFNKGTLWLGKVGKDMYKIDFYFSKACDLA